jgi:hypothetical protein
MGEKLKTRRMMTETVWNIFLCPLEKIFIGMPPSRRHMKASALLLIWEMTYPLEVVLTKNGALMFGLRRSVLFDSVAGRVKGPR